MRRTIAAIIVIGLLFGMTACGAASQAQTQAAAPGAETAAEMTTLTKEQTAAGSGTSQAAESESGRPETTETAESETAQPETSQTVEGETAQSETRQTTESETTETAESETARREEPDWDAITCQPVEYRLGRWYIGEDVVYFGPNGEKVAIPAFPVKDVFTGEPRYYTVSCTGIASLLDWEKEDEAYQLLFDAQGNLLEKKLTGVVNDAVGDLLILSQYHGEDMDCGLWDPEQGRYVTEDISYMIRLDEDTALVMDADGDIRGTMDRESLQVREVSFDVPLNTQWAAKGLIMTCAWDDGGDPDMVILNKDLKEVWRTGPDGYSYDSCIFDCGEVGTFLSVNDRDGGCIICVKGNEAQVIYEGRSHSASDLFLTYCDGERMVVQDRGEFFLCDLEGNKLTEAYESMGEVRSADGEARYAAFQLRTIYILDGDGQILDRKEISGLSEVNFPGGMISYTAYSDDVPDGSLVAGLMDSAFCDIIPADRDQSIFLTPIGDGADHIWEIIREVNGNYRYDLYNSVMEPIVLNASLIGTMTERGIALRRGFSQGVMGFDGSWVVEYSIYEDEWRD